MSGVIEPYLDSDGTVMESLPVPASATLFRTDDPAVIVERATSVADVLSKVLRDKNLTSTISGREHVRVEGWTLCGSMLGVFPVVEWTRPVEGGWEARVEARTLSGAVVGAAEAECLRSEKEWGPNPTRGKPKDDYALRSMAQTRAVSKALRGPLGFVVSLAGFDATPEEEMPRAEQPEQRKDLDSSIAHRWSAIQEIVEGWGPVSVEDLRAFGELAKPHLDGVTLLDASKQVVGALAEQFPPGVFPLPGPADWQREWARVLGGVVLEVEVGEAALSAEQQAALDEIATRVDEEVPL